MFYQVTYLCLMLGVWLILLLDGLSVHFDYPLSLCLPGIQTYLSCLAIRHSAFYCTNCNNTSSYIGHISHNKVRSHSGLPIPPALTIFLLPFLQQSQSLGCRCAVGVRVETAHHTVTSLHFDWLCFCNGSHLLQRKVFADREWDLYWSVGIRTNI